MQKEKQSVCNEIVFNKLFADYSNIIRNYIYYKCGDEEEANDIIQESFIKLWNNCASVPFAKAKAFLYTVANNLFLNNIAHKKVVLKYTLEKPQDSTAESPQFILEEKEYMEKLQNAIANLTEAQRTAFLLNRIDGKKYTEIAEILDISVKAVEKRIHGALVSLRKEIEKI
ncbi:RNA polymerase sigma factor [Abyssalbus ytuae]|uniref:RNA polymerase sigma factor n=1 Tax=Abyssalbus ytuae TaxID=2926907 RepID=A0A9E7CYA1_9FLAO|nr:RNA polymerase sigma factor [Abyssalbus ytuae]UOB16435.1 RNA polymerase sigma factor [Abyssalbus ytuae]